MERETRISDAEWVVMEALWELGEGAAGDVIRHLERSTTWNHRTIRTLLARLVEKELVGRVGDGPTFVYRPLARREACVRREGRSFLKRVFQGDPRSLLLHFAREARLGPEKLDELRRLLEDESSK